ncbi:TetR/AcrR family transcriptional regulator [Nocardia sp. NPDC051833]|uniref:TetR/AcrR family transcriptional regulator n=1 Tax=Nocardia sp. NPDC051833 TaxID=3155674 RepID=UPI00341DD517
MGILRWVRQPAIRRSSERCDACIIGRSGERWQVGKGDCVTQGTRAAQRDATRQAIVDAAVACLTVSGYSAVRTRQIAQAAGVAQGTVTHHFPSRDALLTEAVSRIIDDRVVQARSRYDPLAAGGRTAEVHLDILWSTVTTPEGLAVAHLWYATWSEPQLIPLVRVLEERMFRATVQGWADFAGREPDRDVLVYIDLVLSVMRGLVQSIPTRGLDAVEQRWQLSKALLLTSAPTSAA